MPVYAFTQKFKLGRLGWNERYYWTTGGGSIQDALAKAAELSTLRRALLGIGPSLVGTEVEDVTPVGPLAPTFTGTAPPGPNPSSTTYNLDGGGTTNVANLAVDSPEDCALIDIYSQTGLYRRSFEMHGVGTRYYDRWGTGTGLQQLTSLAKASIKNYFIALGMRAVGVVPTVTSEYAFRGRVYRGDPNAFFSILAVNTISATDHRWVLTVDGGSGREIGQDIHVTGMRGCWAKGLNGDARIINFSHAGPYDFLTLNKVQCCLADIDYDGSAFYALLMYKYVPWSYFTVARYASRKVGKAPFGTRGRSKTRVCC